MRGATPVLVAVLAVALALPAGAAARGAIVSGRVVRPADRPRRGGEDPAARHLAFAVEAGQTLRPALSAAACDGAAPGRPRPRPPARLAARGAAGEGPELRAARRAGRGHALFREQRGERSPAHLQAAARADQREQSRQDRGGPARLRRGLDRRLNYLENDIAELEPALHGAIAAVRGAYCGQASRFRSLRRSRDARVRELAAARDAGLTARPAIHSATYPLEERLAVWQSGSAEIPVNTVMPVTSVTTILFETLERLP